MISLIHPYFQCVESSIEILLHQYSIHHLRILRLLPYNNNFENQKYLSTPVIVVVGRGCVK